MRYDFEIEIRPPEGQEICDFCGGTPIHKGYDCDDFPTDEVRGEAAPDIGLPAIRIHSISMGAWAACETCALLIDDEQWSELTERSLEMLLHQYPQLKASRSQLHRDLAQTHKEFRRLKKLPN